MENEESTYLIWTVIGDTVKCYSPVFWQREKALEFGNAMGYDFYLQELKEIQTTEYKIGEIDGLDSI